MRWVGWMTLEETSRQGPGDPTELCLCDLMS